MSTKESDDYVVHAKDSLKYCRKLLQCVGVWPFIGGFRSRSHKIVSILVIAFCIIAGLFVVLPMAYYMMFDLREVKNKDIIKIVGPLCYCTLCLTKLLILLSRTGDLKGCVKHMEHDWKFILTTGNRQIVQHNVTLATNVTVALIGVHYVFDTMYCTVLPVFTDSFQISGNRSTRALVYPGMELFVDALNSPTYELIYFGQCLYGIVTVTAEVTTCGMMATMVAHAHGMFQIQMKLMGQLIELERKKPGASDALLRVIVGSHERTLRFANDISVAFQEFCFMEVVGTTIVICALEYYCIVEWANNHDMVALAAYCCLIFSLIFNMLVICFVGECLVDEAERMGEVAYNIHWYELRGKKGLNLVLIINITRYPPKLSGGKIFEISMNTFGTVLKSSVVYMHLMQAIME